MSKSKAGVAPTNVVSIGIDPGKHGFIFIEDFRVVNKAFAQIPFRFTKEFSGEFTTGEHRFQFVDLEDFYSTGGLIYPLWMHLFECLASFIGDAKTIISIEQMSCREMGAKGAMTQGNTQASLMILYNYLRFVRGLDVKLTCPVPHKWKSHFGLNRRKKKSTEAAIKFLPEIAPVLEQCDRKTADLAEAFLIGLYGFRMMSKRGV